MLKRIVVSCLKRIFVPILSQIKEYHLTTIQQLERTEDRIVRIEKGLEKAGFLSKETRIKIRHLTPSELEIEEAFDYIYEHHIWSEGKPMPSGTGSYGPWAKHFTELAKKFVESHSIQSITDIGCGDFNVGSQICESVKEYHALDVSAQIIRRNQARFRHLDHVFFQQRNACVDKLPTTELAIIRQVLQHLSNEQIQKFLDNVAKTGYKYVLVAEHLPTATNVVKPNIDMENNSCNTRLSSGSGVWINEPPFNFSARQIDEIEGEGGRLVVFLWEPAQNK